MKYTLGLLFIIFYFAYNWGMTATKIENGELEDNLKVRGLGYLFMLPYQLLYRVTLYLEKLIEWVRGK